MARNVALVRSASMHARSTATSDALAPLQPQSRIPPKVDSGADYVLAKVDDLVNWARRVSSYFPHLPSHWAHCMPVV